MIPTLHSYSEYYDLYPFCYISAFLSPESLTMVKKQHFKMIIFCLGGR